MASRITPLRLALLEAGRSQKWLAEQIDMHESGVSRLVNGLRPSDETKRAIAYALSLDVLDLWPEPGHGDQVSTLPNSARTHVGDDLKDAA